MVVRYVFCFKLSDPGLILSRETCLGMSCSSDMSRSSLVFLKREILTPKSIRRGSTTFREAYERTGRILNVSCVPSDPHSPTILTNHLTAPDCVIWSAVLASAAVPGILNPVVLMMKKPNGTLTPYSFGHKWKDGRYVVLIATHSRGLISFSLRTDIPLKALNLHFGVNFSIVSQVNPHINLFFFSSRGAVGRPGT